MEEYIVGDKRKQFWIMAIISAISLLITLDYSSLNISLPSIASYFGVKVSAVAWLPTLYLLIITSSLLGFGKLGDISGYKRVFIIGVGIFAVAAFACAIAPNFMVLVIARIVLSFGQSMYSPISIAILTTFLPSNMKGRALGLYATFQGLGLAAGPLMGGYMNTNFNWRGNFLITLPLSLIILVVAIKMLPSKQAAVTDTRFDFIGAILLFLGMIGLLYAINQGTQLGWGNPIIIASILVALVGFILFVIQEKRIPYPLLDFNLFKNLNFTFAVSASFFGLALYIGIVFLYPFYLQMMRHLNVAQTGIILMVPSIMMMVLAPIAGSLSDKIGCRRLCMLGMVLATGAFVMIAFQTQTSSIWFIFASMFCLGTGMGFFVAPNNKLVMQNAPSDKQGVASGVYKICLNAGSSIGIALFMLVLAQVVLFDVAKMNIMLTQVRQYPNLMMAGFRGAFVLGIVLGLLTLLFSFLAKDNK
ncbi:MAG: DHA2 family efflux MFS transporter permease subunit [Candidatus Margulisbacteria bacterium]|nr:DHA2 family efflux MFS transporter permease subunit [Candidatus Margulisiibacteriota bacterium]MBU1729587.1 DHA2 family efflux MFS transporter permease subunit [Candidatus Margulisiibacteriota bacterium]MBU1956012.1 DHA2 family efflux MFS transporter permease subunit [Candidatus Margulisiibacteriota bacterium]